jgi:YD repeat-containing protein
MTSIKIFAPLLALSVCLLGGFQVLAHAVQAVNWIYDGNYLIEVDFDDGSSIQYGYDDNGNRISKTYATASAKQFYTVTASAGAGGTISPYPPNGQVSVLGGGAFSFDILPNPGYYVLSVVVDGNPVGAVTGYTFTNVAANHTISAAFTAAFPITVAVTGQGTVSPGSTTVGFSQSQTFTFTPNTGANIADVVVDGSSVGTPAGYTFANVIEPHSISVYFQGGTYSIITSTLGGGSIAPASPMVIYGANQTFTITPPQGVTVYDVQADGISLGTVTSYTFTNVTFNHTLSAIFSMLTPQP